jgi:hypothetical protein
VSVDPGRLALLATVTEKQWSGTVRGWAERLGWEVLSAPWSSIHSPAGLPDLILCRPPRLIFAELKTERGFLTKRQSHCIALLQRCPQAEVYVWRPHDEPFVLEVLGAHE